MTGNRQRPWMAGLLRPERAVVAFLGAVVGFELGSSPGISIMGASSTTFEGIVVGIVLVLGIVGLAIRLAGAAGNGHSGLSSIGALLIFAAAGTTAGGAIGVAVRPGPPVSMAGSTTISIDEPVTMFTVRVTCRLDAASGDHVEWADSTTLSIDRRPVFLFGGVSDDWVSLSLTQSGIPDSSPFVEANEYSWTVDHLTGAAEPGWIVLADEPVPTAVEVPNAPPMTIADVSIGPHFLSGSFRFTGMRAVSADHPFSGTGWPLVLSGTIAWSCGS